MNAFRGRLLPGGLALLLLWGFAPSAFAVDYFADAAGGSWTTNTTWRIGSTVGPNPSPGNYPGSGAGDQAHITLAGVTVTLSDFVLNSVTLNANNTNSVTVGFGGSLPLTGASQIAGGATLTLAGGTVSNGGTLTVAAGSGLVSSNGSLTGSGSTTLSSGALLTIQGGSLDAHTLNIDGSAILTGAWAVNDGAQVNIGVAGLFDIQSTGPISSNNPTNAEINNSGTFSKSASSSTNVDVPMNNNANVIVTTGALVLGGNPTHTNGSFNISAGSSIEFHGTFAGTNNVIGGGDATIVGTPTVADGATVNFTNVTMNGGWIQGPAAGLGTINVSGTVAFNSGVWRQNLQVNLLFGSVTNVQGFASAFIADSALVDNLGTINLTGFNGLFINNGGAIDNHGTINLAGDILITSDDVNGAHIDNRSGASIFKTAGAGTATLQVMLDNDGNVRSNSGDIRFTRSGSHTGTFDICHTCTFDFADGTHTLDGAQIRDNNTGDNAIAQLSGATFNVPTTAQIDTNFEFRHSAGTITGNGTLTILAAYKWSGGTQSGPGQTQLGNYSHVFSGANGAMLVSGRQIQIQNIGSVDYSPTGANFLSLNSNAIFTNAGTLNLLTDAPIVSDGTGLISNQGSVNKSGGGGQAVIQATFNNSGPGATLNVSSGQVALNGGGSNQGNLLVPSAANAVVFGANTYALNAGTAVNPADLGVIRVDGGTLNLGTPLTLNRVELRAGTLGGADLNINSALSWTGGTNLGPGLTTIASTATLSHLAPTQATFLVNRILQNHGLVEYEGSGLTLANGASIFNNPSAEFRAGDGVLLNGGGSVSFINFGTLRKNSGTGNMHFNVPVTNSGTVSSEMSGQSLLFAAGGTQNAGGTLTTSADAAIGFSGGLFQINDGTLGGAGRLRVVGGALQINTSLLAATTLAVESGALRVPAPNTFQVNTLLFNGGGLQDGGTTRAFAGAIGNGAPSSLSGDHTLAIAGTFDDNASSANFLTVNDTSALVVENGVTFSITDDSRIAGAATAQLSNNGTVRKTGGVGIASIEIPVTSNGTAIGSDSGALRLSGGGTITTPIEIGAGAALEFAGGNFSLNGGAAVSGSGTFRVIAGVVDTSAALTILDLALEGGVLQGSGALAVANVAWNGGSLDGAGAATVTGPMTIATAAAKSLGRALTNNGSTAVQSDLGGAGTFANYGTFSHSSAAAHTFAPAFANYVDVDLLAGDIAFTSGFVQSSGTMDLLGGTFSSPLLASFNGGLLRGNGTIGASVANNDATVAPGASAGSLTINGDYSQSAIGILNIELAGTTPGSGYDRLAITGNATLAGQVNVTLSAPFTLSGGDTFDVVTYGSRTGTFTSESLPSFATGTFSSSYSPTAYRLAASAFADVAVTMTGPLAGIAGDTITYTITALNNGPGTPASITIQDLLPDDPNLTFVSALGGTPNTSDPAVGSSGGIVDRSFTGVGPSQAVELTVVMAVDIDTTDGTIFSNSATADGSSELDADPNPNNNATTILTPALAYRVFADSFE